MSRTAVFLAFVMSIAPPVLAGPLHDAAREGDLEAVETLLAEGAVVDERGADGETPLTLAILEGHDGVARFLIERGADIHARNEGGFTPLHAAAYVGDATIAELLIDKGADVNDAENDAGVTPLFPAVEEKHEAVAELLLAASADLNVTERHGYTPLTRATFKDNEDMIKLLKAHGAECQPKAVLGSLFHPRCLEMGS